MQEKCIPEPWVQGLLKPVCEQNSNLTLWFEPTIRTSPDSFKIYNLGYCANLYETLSTAKQKTLS